MRRHEQFWPESSSRAYVCLRQAIVGILKAIRELMSPPEPKKRPIGFVYPEEKK